LPIFTLNGIVSPWIYRTTALVASWFVLGAYILAPLIFTSASDNLKTTRNTMVALAVAMLVLGYATLIATATLSRNLLFCFECVALPALTSSVEGLFSVVMNHALHKGFPVSDTYIVDPLVLVCISVVAFGLWAAFLYHRIHRIKGSDGGRPVPLTISRTLPFARNRICIAGCKITPLLGICKTSMQIE
jgi:hypothetical protein